MGYPVFLSWSGSESRAIAVALRDWLPDVIQAVEPFMSEHDISAGTRGLHVLADELAQQDFGILCVTPANLEAPWLLFEAGALSKANDESRVIPFLHRVTIANLPGPLQQFQSKRSDDPDEVWAMVRAINDALEDPLDETRVRGYFDERWPRLADELNAIEPEDPDAEPPSVNPGDLIPEVLSRLTSIESALRSAQEPRITVWPDSLRSAGSEHDPILLTLPGEGGVGTPTANVLERIRRMRARDSFDAELQRYFEAAVLAMREQEKSGGATEKSGDDHRAD